MLQESFQKFLLVQVQEVSTIIFTLKSSAAKHD